MIGRYRVPLPFKKGGEWSLVLHEYARKFNYEVIPEVAVMGTKGKKV